MKARFYILPLAAVIASACSGAASPTAPSGTLSRAASSHKFEAISAGYLLTMPVAGLAEFRVDSARVFSMPGGDVDTARGFNLAVYDSSGSMLQPVRSFETRDDALGANARDFVAALNDVPDRAVVMISVADESGLTVMESCTHKNTPDTAAVESALRALGSSLIGNYCYRNSWSMIAVKGAGVKDEQLSKIDRVTSRYSS